MAIITRWRMPPDIWCGYSSKRRSGAGMRTRCSAAMARLRSAPAEAVRSCARIASVIWSPTVNTGFRLVIGSWKIIAMRLPRMSRICAGDRSSRFLPSN